MNYATTAGHAPFLSQRSFSELATMALWGICLNPKKQVVATHRELAVLRRCATLVTDAPDQVIHVVSPSTSRRTDFIVNTLMHFGVSCGQINVSSTDTEHNPDGVWLFVENRRRS